MKKNKIKFILSLLILIIPSVSFAALEGVVDLVKGFGTLLASVIPVLVGLAVIYFFWGVGQFILHDAGNDKAREDGKKKILWGIIALFVMISLWGITAWIGQVVGIDNVGQNNSLNNSGSTESPWSECPQGFYSDNNGRCIPD